ncbi:hypothetical protein Tco_0273846 [Tanacetum coccineum]
MIYRCAEIEWYDLVDSERFSINRYDAMLEDLGINDGSIFLFSHFRIPGKSFDEGLAPLISHQDVFSLLKYVPRYKEIKVYIEKHTMEVVSGKGKGVVIEEIMEDDEVNEASETRNRGQSLLLDENDVQIGNMDSTSKVDHPPWSSGSLSVSDIMDPYDWQQDPYHRDDEAKENAELFAELDDLLERLPFLNDELKENVVVVDAPVVAVEEQLERIEHGVDVEIKRPRKRKKENEAESASANDRIPAVLKGANIFYKNGIHHSYYRFTFSFADNVPKQGDVDDPVNFALAYREKMIGVIFYCIPRCTLEKGLIIVEGDGYMKKMHDMVETYGLIDLYITHIPKNLAEYYYKNLTFNASHEEVTSKVKTHEKRKQDAGSMSFEELVAWPCGFAANVLDEELEMAVAAPVANNAVGAERVIAPSSDVDSKGKRVAFLNAAGSPSFKKRKHVVLYEGPSFPKSVPSMEDPRYSDPFLPGIEEARSSRDALCNLCYPDVQCRLDGLTLTELTNFHDVAAVRFVMSNNLLTCEAQALSAEVFRLCGKVEALKDKLDLANQE